MNSFPPITLESERLLLRTMQPSDLDGLLKIFTDQKVMDAFNHPLFTREQMEGWMARNLSHQEQFGYGLFSVILKSENQLIGDCSLENMDVDGTQETELGYDFLSDYWNQGFATEAGRAVVAYGFDSLNLQRIFASYFMRNPASGRVLGKIGMQEEGILRAHVQKWGRPEDLVICGIVKNKS